jgi:hypothetical protein
MSKDSLVKLTEVYDPSYNRDKKSLREIYVNPNFVASLIPDYSMDVLFAEGKLPEGLNRSQQFTRIILADGRTQHIVVGDLSVVQSKLSPTILKG